ncbi:magnesium transporter MRS2-1 isoform X2 [Physcomitrium patens]|uniref:Magnesium transporter n=1 Tax=Physcomitrium patens TaxID=3218 RepID=A0A7I4CUQ1_PHYPA|nr:magnesium transporter MRS2-1-like isoform X2 [Physcomitrium patens]|eukprot:XP_024364810.1 magnesium transporter MRS2-1-like isoform X2 [Physcomitrella patens]
MADLKARLLPPRPPGAAGPSEGISKRPETLKRPLFQGMEGVSLKKRGHGVRSWIRIDPSGNTQILEVDKASLMRRCDLPARDLRLLDPLFVYPSTILGRERAIVVNLEQIRCIITADEILLLNSIDSYVLQYVTELQRRLFMKNRSDIASLKWSQSPVDYTLSGAANGFDVPLLMSSDERKQTLHDGDMFSGSSADDLPFEFQALEVALEAACTFLDAQVRDEIEQLMDDDSDMAEMYLTEKKEQHAEYAFFDQKLGSHLSFNYVGAGGSMSAPVSPVGSPVGSTYHSSVDRRLEKSLSQKSRHDSMSSSRVTGVEELEMLLEAYFVVIDGTLNKLTSLKEYIDDTEDFINIQLDNVRNQLIQFELLLTTATFVLAIYSVVAGVFGMNIPIALFDEPESFKWVLIISGVGGFLIFIAFLWFFKQKRLMPL